MFWPPICRPGRGFSNVVRCIFSRICVVNPSWNTYRFEEHGGREGLIIMHLYDDRDSDDRTPGDPLPVRPFIFYPVA